VWYITPKMESSIILLSPHLHKLLYNNKISVHVTNCRQNFRHHICSGDNARKILSPRSLPSLPVHYTHDSFHTKVILMSLLNQCKYHRNLYFILFLFLRCRHNLKRVRIIVCSCSVHAPY